MDMDALMTRQGMRDMTEEQRDTWANDAVQIRQIAQIIQARLANTHIDGDSTGTAARRARKVVKPLVRAARLLEKAAAQMEGANALYVREVLELPERRSNQMERKELRRHKLGIAAATAKTGITDSLTASTQALHHGTTTPTGNPQVTAAQQPVYTNPNHYNFAPQTSADQLPPIGDFFDQAAM
jgi:hypothetical protein